MHIDSLTKANALTMIFLSAKRLAKAINWRVVAIVSSSCA